MAKNEKAKRNKRNAFCCLRYQEEIKQGSSIAFQGVYEMMHARQCIWFMSKPKNGTIDADEAKKMWDEQYHK